MQGLSRTLQSKKRHIYLYQYIPKNLNISNFSLSLFHMLFNYNSPSSICLLAFLLPFDPSIRDSGFLISGQEYRIIFINIIRLALGQTCNVNVVVVSVVVVPAMLLQQSMLLLVSLSLLLLLMLLLGPLIIFKDICRYS